MAYTSPKIEVRESKQKGKGVFAKRKIEKGELIFDFEDGRGKFYSSKDRAGFNNKWKELDIQVDDNLYWGAVDNSEVEVADYINHSCNPNSGISGSLKIVAMRDINSGEEITFDYAMSESHRFKMQCFCGQKKCRRLITGNDWKIKELQKRYIGYFSDYLQRKIDNINKK